MSFNKIYRISLRYFIYAPNTSLILILYFMLVQPFIIILSILSRHDVCCIAVSETFISLIIMNLVIPTQGDKW